MNQTTDYDQEFDYCDKSPTGKHSESWYCNDDCDHCKSGAQPDAPLYFSDDQGFVL